MKVPEDAMDQAAAKVAGTLSTDPLDTAARDVVGQQRTAVKASVYNALLENPDMAARAQQLGRQTGMPADVVQRNLPEVERGIYLNNIDKLLEQHPAITEFLARPEFAAVAHDDVENLGALDTAMRGFKRTGGAAMSGLWSLAGGLTGLARAPVEVAAPLLDPLVGRVLPENPLRRVGAGMGGAQEFLTGQAQANMPRVDGNLGSGFYSGVASLSRNLAALPIAIVNPPLGLTIMAGSVAGEEYGKAREQNLAPLMATSYGATQGAIEYATERLPLMKLLGDLKVGAPLWKMLGTQMAAEVPGEQIATVLQDLNEWAVLPENQDKPFSAYIAERPDAAVQTLVATVVGVGGQVSVVKGIEALLASVNPQEPTGEAGAAGQSLTDVLQVSVQVQTRMAQAELAERDAQALTQLADVVQQGKLAGRDPTAFQEFAQRVAESSPVQDVYINAQTFAQMAQDAGVTEQQIPEGIREQLPEALATGGDIRIPIAEFAAQIAPTQYAQGLIDHLKTDPLGMSRAEAQVFMQTQMEEMQAEVEKTMAASENALEFRTSLDTVRQQFAAQLDTAARFTPDVNQSYASLMANFYGVTAAKVGMTPEQLAAMYPLQVQAEGVTGATTMMDQGGMTRVYHGTTAEAAAAIEAEGFDVRKSADGTIWFTSNPEIGEVAATGKGAVVERAFSESDLKLGGWEESDKYSTNELIALGYDGLKLEDTGETTYQIFNPEKLKRVPVMGQEPLRVVYRGTNDSSERIKGGISEGALFAAADEDVARNYAGSDGRVERIAVKPDAKILVEGSAEYAQVTGRRRGRLINTMRKGENLKSAADDVAAKARAAGYDAVEFTSFKDLGIAIFNEDKFIRDYAESPETLNQSALPDTIEIDGIARPTTNSNGQPIHPTEQGVRNFWRWFGDSKVVDAQGRPLVVYHGTPKAFKEFKKGKVAARDPGFFGAGFYFTPSENAAADYAESAASADRIGTDGEVMAVYLSIKGPFVWDMSDDGQEGTQAALAAFGVKRYNVRGDSASLANPDERRKFNRGIQAAGHDGILVRDEDGFRELVALDPSQIKSATGNAGDFNPNTPNILFQGDDKDLIVTHNLTAENLLHAQRMGGIPVPSLAITKKDSPLTSFGEITLIGPPEMADPRGYASTKVFGADIYSPRYPSIERQLDPKAVKQMRQKFDAMAELMGSRLPDQQDLERDAIHALERHPAIMGQFLRDNNVEPAPVYRPGMKPEREARLRQFGLEQFLGNTDYQALMQDEAFLKAATAEMIDAYESVGDRYQGLVEKLKTDPQARNNLLRDSAREIANAAQRRNRPEIDNYETTKALDGQIQDNDLQASFKAYLDEIVGSITESERIFQGFTYAGKRRYIQHTLDNVVKILKKELRGGEGFNYGVGSLRSKFTPQFRSVTQIRENKHRLVTDEQFKAIKDEIDAEFISATAAISPDLSLNTAMAIMEDTAQMGAVRAAKGYGIDITPEAALQVNNFLAKLKSLPTEYFEAKILREVDLAEFAGAVVPEGTDPKAIEALQQRGVKDIRYYKPGDEAARAAQIGEFKNLFFQGLGKRGQIAFDQDITKTASVITLLKGADLSTFLHESGHFFLEVQMDLAARIAADPTAFGNSAGSQQMLQDTQALLDWFGVKSIPEWFSLPIEQKTFYHEKFARGFEAYLFEGNTPSIEMQSMFQRFRAWMIRVYKDMKALNVELTDEVRGVMDRMIATTEQIELAERGRSMMPLFASAQQAGMTTDEFAAYQDQGIEATQDAIQDLQARTLRDMQWMRNARGREVKKLQKLSAERRREMRIEARRQIMADPTYQAWAFLTNKMDANDKAAVTPVEPRKSKPGRVDPEVDSLFVAIAKLGGLDRGEIESTWGWDTKERSPMPIFGKYLLRREGGRSIDEMGEALAEYGYLPLGKDGKHDNADLERLFDDEYRGTPRYSEQKDYSDIAPDVLPGETVDFENLGAGRLDIGALRTEVEIPDEVVAILEKHKMTATNGIHPDFVAEQFGFTSGNELVRRLAAAEPPQSAIEGLTDQIMLERFGELSSPEAIERAADAAIHNDARARFVATELNALQRATGKPKVLAAAAKDYARTMVSRLLVRNVRPGQYVAAEVRAAKAAEKAMKAGDTQQAAAKKRNQLINTYAAKAAHDAITEVEQALRYLKKFQNDGTRKRIDVDYLDQIDTILERFDLRVGQSLKSIDKRKSLAAWIGEQEDLGLEVDLPEKIRAEAFRQSYKDLSVEEMRGLIDSIKQIEHLGRLKEKLLTAADNRQFAEVVRMMVDRIVESAGGRKVNNRTRDTLGSRAISLFKGFVAAHRKVASLARELDGFNDAGPVWEYLIRAMNTAGDKEATMRASATQQIAALLKPITDGKRLGGKGQYFPQLGLSLNRGEQLVLALNMGNAGNMQRLLDGRGWTLAQVEPVLQNLTAADLQFVQSIWDYFEGYRPEIAAKERRVMGKEPAWVEPQALTVRTADGQEVTLRGGYFPIVYDTRESGRAEQQADAEQAKQMMKGAFVTATTRRSFTKTRAEAVSGRPLALTWDALFRGVNDVIHDLSWHEWVIDANRIIRNDAVDKAIRTGFGADVVQQFKTAIRDIATGEAQDMDALSRVVAPIRKGAAVAGLGFNILNAMIQPLGLTQSMVRIGPQWVLKGVARWAQSPVQLVRDIHEKSAFMKNRAATTTARDLNEIQSVVQGKSEARRKLDAVIFLPMVSMQIVADVPTWWGAYEKALADAPVDVDADAVEARAVALADQAVIDSQASGQIKDLAAIQRGGQLQRLFTVFYGYFSASYNIGVERAKATNFRSPLEVMKLAQDYLLLFVAPAMLAELVYSALQGEDDEPEEMAKKLAGAQLSYLMGTMVGLREASLALQKATGTNQFSFNYGGPAGLRFLQELDKLGMQVGQGEVDRALTRSLVNVGGVLLHLPSGQINRTIDGVIAVSEGDANAAAILFGPPPESR